MTKSYIPVSDPPSSPQDLRVLGTDSGSVSLSWDPAQETAKAPVDGYIIEIAEGNSKDFSEIAIVDKKTCTFKATDLEEGMKYDFCVKAQNSSGNSSGFAQLHKPVFASSLGKLSYWSPSRNRQLQINSSP